jgi:uncharacterized protein YecE (DUF72 family)
LKLRGEYFIGISGWRYAGWRRTFYPEDLPQRRELEYASRCLRSIELNGSFYSLQTPTSYRRWYEETPDDFVFSIKGPRYISHILRLEGAERPIATFFGSGLLGLREKLGAILWQLPPNFKFDEARLDAFFAALPRTTAKARALALRKADRARLREKVYAPVDQDRTLRYALEVRNETFAENPRFLRLLRRQGIALVCADAAAKWPFFDVSTAKFTYARLHGGTALYASEYGTPVLKKWAVRAKKWHRRGDVFVYFDNDVKTHAPFDAMKLRAILGLKR